LQNSVSFAVAMQFLALRAAKHAIFSGCSYKTEVLQEPLLLENSSRGGAGSRR